MAVYSSSLELYVASGGSGMDEGGGGAEGASAGSGVGESNTRGSSGGSGETEIESRISIIAMQIGCARINC
jgi:hypothetical protein